MCVNIVRSAAQIIRMFWANLRILFLKIRRQRNIRAAHWKPKVRLVAILHLAFIAAISAQDAVRTPAEPESPAEEPYRSPSELKKLPLEALVDVEIMSVSRRPEPLWRAASAVSVLTGTEIERAGATNIPDALRLDAGMQVAQIDGHTWAISARGFNISAANKMQVLMDGRSVYTPLFSGVFWDVQQTFLPDLQQIEVIQGPGATLWGANAVNGVVNIITKSAKDTQGLLIYGGGGSELMGFGGVRYGGAINKNTSYRAYVMHQSRDSLSLEGGGNAEDETDFTQGGFRIDSELNPENTFTLQGDIYAGEFGQLDAPNVEAEGGNIIGRWTHQFDRDTSLMVQTYYDYTHRLVPDLFEEDRHTFDLEAQQRFVLGQHDLIVGGQYRVSADEIGNPAPSFSFTPDADTLHLVSLHVQDEWHLVPDTFTLIGGSKFEYNNFSGFEIQPTGRFAWTPAEGRILWGAISRAVRTPTRIDRDLVIPNPSFGGVPIFFGSRDFESEELIAYELGYRTKLLDNLSLDVAAYYNEYDNLRSLEPRGPSAFPIVFENKLEGTSVGGAVGVRWRITDWWEVNGNLNLLHIDIDPGPGSADLRNGSGEGNDPNCSLVAHSMLDLPGNIKFDTVLRFVNDLPQPATPAYVTMDLRVAWSPIKNLEVSVVGRDLLDNHHPEFRGTTITREVGRSVFAMFKWTY